MNTSHSRSWLVVVFLCVVSAALMLTAAYGDAPIMDELAHIPAGYGYVRYLDYRLNPEHPPLVKVLAELPVLFTTARFPVSNSSWTQDVNGQWATGTQFLYESGNDTFAVLQLSRLGPILLTLLLIVFTYLWARELMGRRWALLPTFLLALSPTVLAHGHYVTTDIGAALGVVMSTYYFLKFLFSPRRGTLFMAAVSFGVAQLMKFSAVLLIPYFIFLALAFAGIQWLAKKMSGGEIGTFRPLTPGSAVGALAFIFILGYALVVYPVYGLFTAHYPKDKQVSDTAFILGSFGGGETPTGKFCRPARCLADADIWLTKHTLTRPLAHYVLGVLMVLQRSDGGNTNYFLGQVSAAGSPRYFPVIFALKEPLPALILILTATLSGLWGVLKAFRPRAGTTLWRRAADYANVNFSEFAMLVFVIFYWAYSIRSPLNIGVRHLLPTFPFIYILVAGFWKRWLTRRTPPPFRSWLRLTGWWLKTLFASSLKYALFSVLLLWLAAESVLAAPYFLSYFNETGGGVRGGWRYVTDSNYDWGQDLGRLEQWVKEHPEVDRIAVDYFGGGNLNYSLGDRAEGWSSARGNPADIGIHWLAISVNTLQGARQPLAPGQNRQPEDEYRWLSELRPIPAGLGQAPAPDYRAGTSIFIYHLE